MPLRLVRRPKTPYWIVRGTVRGIRIEESAGTNDKRIAEEIRAKREAEILAEAVYGRRATATFAQAALSYLEQGGSRRYLNEIISYFGITALARINQDAVDSGARKLYPDGSASTRVRQRSSPLAAALAETRRVGFVLPDRRPPDASARRSASSVPAAAHAPPAATSPQCQEG
jgi:hypothetical protein